MSVSWQWLSIRILSVAFMVVLGGGLAPVQAQQHDATLGASAVLHIPDSARLPASRRVVIGLHKVGGWGGLQEKVNQPEFFSSWSGAGVGSWTNPLGDWIGIVFGLGFVLSFGYWTTNFVEVQRAMASDSISSARKTPVIGAFPKMFVPFLTIVPGMIAAVLVSEIADLKAGGHPAGGSSGTGVTYNDSLLLLMRDLLPNGLLGLAITGLLAAFMAGMAANISAFNTVFSYDLWGDYVVKDREDDYYLKVGRLATLAATVIAIATALIAGQFSNIMDYLQTLFGFFNAPLFATFILGMFWKRMTPTAGWVGLVAGTLSAVAVWAGNEWGPLDLPGQGAAFLAASTAFVVDIVLSVVVSMVTKPKPAEQLVGLVYSETPREQRTDPNEAGYPWYRRTVPLASVALVMVIALNAIF